MINNCRSCREARSKRRQQSGFVGVVHGWPRPLGHQSLLVSRSITASSRKSFQTGQCREPTRRGVSVSPKLCFEGCWPQLLQVAPSWRSERRFPTMSACGVCMPMCFSRVSVTFPAPQALMVGKRLSLLQDGDRRTSAEIGTPGFAKLPKRDGRVTPSQLVL
jgi:hypothetical protein